jgi:molybdopterin-guanine dinucleotide biosynthesis protein A
MDKNNLALRSIFTKVRIKYILKKDLLRFDHDLISFFNINTAKDMERAKKLFKEE